MLLRPASFAQLRRTNALPLTLMLDYFSWSIPFCFPSNLFFLGQLNSDICKQRGTLYICYRTKEEKVSWMFLGSNERNAANSQIKYLLCFDHSIFCKTCLIQKLHSCKFLGSKLMYNLISEFSCLNASFNLSGKL